MGNRLGMACVLVLSAASPAARAHHSYAMFDRDKTVTLNGTVRQFQWTNPHSWLQVTVPNDAGGSDEWSVEMGSPFELLRNGWTATTVKAGDRISVQVHPTKDGTKGGGFVAATDAEGHALGKGK